MSTETYDQDRLPALRSQVPVKPWRKRPRSFNIWVALASIFPLVVVVLLDLFTQIPGALLLTVVYFPLQMIASAVAAYFTKGTRGIADSIIIVPSSS